MARYVIDIGYKGSRYCGSAVQPETKTVQGTVQEVFGKILRADIFCYFAGRTDGGVHALKMPAHFDFDGDLPRKFVFAANRLLPHDIAVENVRVPVSSEFNARFDAVSRTYEYSIARKKNPLTSDLSWLYHKDLDVKSMAEAVKILFEFDSFESFCKKGGNNTTCFCRILESSLREETDLLIYRVSADRFLRGMVRAIVGTILEVGKGHLSVPGFREVIAKKDRNAAGNSVAAEGLVLINVAYRDGTLFPYEGWIDPVRGTPGFDTGP